MPTAPVRSAKDRKEIWMQRLNREKLVYESFRRHHYELQTNIQPRRGRHLQGGKEKTNDGRRRNGNIIDSTARLALRALRSGLMAGMSSPMSEWFRMTSWDDELLSWAPAREWLYRAERFNYEVLERSNAYGAFGNAYENCGLFGVSAYGSFEDNRTVVFYDPYSVGTFVFTVDHRGNPNGFYHEYEMTATQMYASFEEKNLTHSVKKAYKDCDETTMFPILWVIEENDTRMPGRYDKLNRPFRSVRFQMYEANDLILEESGFHEFPIMIPRWDLEHTDKWPINCPGMDALGDVMACQRMQTDKLQQLDYRVTPPMRAPKHLQFSPASLLPGHISYYDTAQGAGQFEPLYQVTQGIDDIRQEILETNQRIDKAFFADLWQMLAALDSAGLDRQRTATEIAMRHQEKIMMLAPVLYSFSNDMHRPTIMLQTQRGIRAGILPPPPEELVRAGLKIDLVSVLAEAHALITAGGIERFNGFLGPVVGVVPSVLDVVDWDAQARKYAELTNQPNDMLRRPEEVDEIRAEREAQEQAMRQIAMAEQGAQAAKTLGDTKVTTDTALGQLMGQLGQPAVA
jgi:hypothetical protein